MLKDPKKQADNIQILKDGAKSEFWLLILEALQDSKESVDAFAKQQNLSRLPGEQYKVEHEIISAKKEYIELMGELPTTIAKYLQAYNEQNPTLLDLDPYKRADEF